MKNAATDKTNDLDKLIMDGMGGSGSDKSSDKNQSKAPRSPLVLGIVFILLVGALTVFLISKYMFGPTKPIVKTPSKDITKVSAGGGVCQPTAENTKNLEITSTGFDPSEINLVVDDPSNYCLGLNITNNFGSKQSVFFPSVIEGGNPLNISINSTESRSTSIKFDAYATGLTTQTHYMLGGIYATGFENLKGKIVLTKSASSTTGYQSIALGDYHGCALKSSDGSIVCWGNNDYGQTNAPEGSGYQQISAGFKNSCAIKNNGLIVCWGSNAASQLDDVPTDNNYIQVAANTAICAIRNNKSALCWGGFTHASNATENKQIVSGNTHSCRLSINGFIFCQGPDSGSGKDLLVEPEGNEYTKISLATRHACALKNNGSIVCWGSNDVGQLVGVPTGANFIDVSAGANHTCAINNSGAIVCWGSNPAGQRIPPEGNNFKQISVGNYSACALKNDGSIVCWGDIAAPPSP